MSPENIQLISIYYGNYRFLPTEYKENAPSIIYQDLFCRSITYKHMRKRREYNDFGGRLNRFELMTDCLFSECD